MSHSESGQCQQALSQNESSSHTVGNIFGSHGRMGLVVAPNGHHEINVERWSVGLQPSLMQLATRAPVPNIQKCDIIRQKVHDYNQDFCPCPICDTGAASSAAKKCKRCGSPEQVMHSK